MKVISKYPIIVKGEKANRVIVNNKYEGGFDNAEGDTPAAGAGAQAAAPQASTGISWLDTASSIANSGLTKEVVDVAGKVKTNKTTTPGAGAPPAPTGTGAGSAPASKDEPSKGMSTGAKVGIFIGIAGLITVVVLIAKHNKKAA